METALKMGVRVIPVLVDGAAMPRPRDLPDLMRPLTGRRAVHVRHDTFRSDLSELIRKLDDFMSSEDRL